MATTTNGMPYPIGTDKVVDGDNAIRALAEKVDTSLLPFGHARARCTTSAAVASNAWNIVWLDVLADAHGAQPWTLEPANRTLHILTAGVYLISAHVSMNASGFGVGIGLAPIAAPPFDRIAGVVFGTSNQSNSVSTVRYLAANSYLFLLQSAPAVQNISADAVNAPTYLAIQALGGQ